MMSLFSDNQSGIEMTKSSVSYRCSECNTNYSKWQGQCNECKEWSTIEEVKLAGKQIKSHITRSGYAGAASGLDNKPVKIKDIDINQHSFARVGTGLREMDRMLGGGVVVGSVIFISGSPGAGKSTMLLQICDFIASSGIKVLYASGEESLSQIKMRADRLELGLSENLELVSETCVESIIEFCSKGGHGIIVFDSIQTAISSELESVAGGVAQIKQSASIITSFCKRNNVTSFIVGQVTKDGDMAGPKSLEHMVDVSITLDIQDNSRYRVSRSSKNRFAQTDSAFFIMMQNGMRDVQNPSSLFIENKDGSFVGSSISVIRDGTRCLLVEIQSLVDDAISKENPKRVCIGLDAKRMSLILAVMNSRIGLKTGGKDIYLSIVGGLKCDDTSTDLTVAISIISNVMNKEVPSTIASFGEMGLLGDIRAVSSGVERVREADKLGFKTIIIPKRNYSKELSSVNIKIVQVSSIDDVVNFVKGL